MKILSFLRDFAIIFVLVFIISMIVSYFYGLIAHGVSSVDWELSIRNAFIFGILLPTIRIIYKQQKD